MTMLRNSGLLLTAAVFLSSSFFANARQNNTLTIPYIAEEITIDGDLTEAVWQKANTLTLDVVNSPWDNLPSPVKTKVRYFENGEYLYIAFQADDPHPEKISGFLGARDTTLSEDVVGIKLDPYNNHRLNYEFFVNPYGVQNDGIANENTGELNRNWDGIWYSNGKITESGYQVEMAIPFRILNFPPSQQQKTWSIEFIRLYPRDERLRISHIKFDRNNNCWVCQMSDITGFEKAKQGKNIQLTPYTAASNQQTRDIYNAQDSWHNNKELDAGLDLNWGINASTRLTATLNPDFSTVESDAAQLSANKNFSLFYKEKRAFFLENADYFSSQFNLVYTRNIADPDYGVKLTGRQTKHSYGFFATNDTLTNFIIPGNLSNSFHTEQKQSKAAAVNYKYNVNEDLAFGVISTYRSSDNYHNLVSGIDGKYRFDDSNSVVAQFLVSDTEDNISGFTDDNGQDHAYKIVFSHESEFWQLEASQQQINKKFRADLGYMPKNDYKQTKLTANRRFYGEDNNWWNQIDLYSKWQLQSNQAGEKIANNLQLGANLQGPMLSNFEFVYNKNNTVGLRYNPSNQHIRNNTSKFNTHSFDAYGEFQPSANFFAGVGINWGKQIDYSNDRLGDYQMLYSYLEYKFNAHFRADLYLALVEQDAINPTTQRSEKVYSDDVVDLRFSYQFDVNSYIKLNLVYENINNNVNNNPMADIDKQQKTLSTQLTYAYQLNPQTVFYLGYSDSSYQDDALSGLKRDSRTFFTKVSYAWMP